MGMYTEIVFAAELKKDTPKQVCDVLTFMLKPNGHPSFVLPDHPFFRTEWDCLFVVDSYYFSGDTMAAFRVDEISHCPTLTVRSNIKNYHGEIQHFLDWIAPYIDERTDPFLGYWRYEEDLDPTLIYHRNGKSLPLLPTA